MTTAIILILIALGLVLILLELFVTPGFITGLLGGVAWAYALYKIYADFGNTSGHLALGGLLLLLIACIFIAVKSGMWDRVSLHKQIDSRVNELPDVKVGDTGFTASALRPMGKLVVGQTTLEVTTMGELVEAGAFVEITKIEQNKIYVKQISI